MLRVQADKLNEMAKMNEIVLEKERLRHVQSSLEQQAAYTRIGKLRRPIHDDAYFVPQQGSSTVNHEAKRAISNTMTWMDQIDEEVKFSFMFSFIHFGLTASPISGDPKTESHC